MNDDFIGTRNLNSDARNLRNDHLVGETQVHDQVRPLLGNTVTDAVDVQLLLEALGNTDDHVVEQGAGQAVNAAMQLIVGRTFHGDRRTFLFNDHLRPQALSQFALRSLDGDHIALSNVHGNTGGNGNGHSTNSRHCSIPSLPDECQDFAANVSCTSSLVGHDAL